MGEEISGLSLPLGREEREERGRKGGERERERKERREGEGREREGERERERRRERGREEESYHGTMSHTQCTSTYHNTCNLQTNETSVTRCSYNGMPSGYSSWHMVNRRTLSLQNAHVISTRIVYTHTHNSHVLTGCFHMHNILHEAHID